MPLRPGNSVATLVLTALALSSTLLTLTPVARGQCDVARLVPENPIDAFSFGWSVAICGDGTLGAVGMYRQGGGLDHGFVTIWELIDSEWDQTDIISPPYTDPDLIFGIGLDISADGRRLAVGLPSEDSPEGDLSVGAVYIFEREKTGWEQRARLMPSRTWEWGLFGVTLALSDDGTTLIAGSVDDFVADSVPGAAFIFTRDAFGGWHEQAMMRPAEVDVGDRFGEVVALSGNGRIAIVSAYEFDENGAVYVYERNGTNWTLAMRILPGRPSQTSFNFGLGSAVSGDGQVLVIGMPGDEGGAQVFLRDASGWDWEATLTSDAFEESGYSEFGSGLDVSADGTVVLIGSGQVDAPSGAVIYRREHEQWRESAVIRPKETSYYDGFGRAVALSADGDTALIGAWQAFVDGTRSGAAHVFRGTRLIDCNDNGTADACDLIAGTANDVNGNGVPDECEQAGRIGTEFSDGLLALLERWGECDRCPEDLDADGFVDADDLRLLLPAEIVR